MADETTGPIERTEPAAESAEITPIKKSGVLCSMRELQDELGLDRDTVKRRILACRIEPAGERQGWPVYRLRDVVQAVMLRDEHGNLDPEKLEPYQRQAYYKAQLDKLKLDTEMRQVVPLIEVEQEQARIFRIVQLFLDTLPDICERDCGIGPGVVSRIERAVNEVRDQLHRAIVEDKPNDQAKSA
jgi:uncharacterized protein DUF1441